MLFWPAMTDRLRAKRNGVAGEVRGNVGGKGVRRLAGYFMGYYTIWLAPVKRFFVPFWELKARAHGTALGKTRKAIHLRHPEGVAVVD